MAWPGAGRYPEGAAIEQMGPDQVQQVVGTEVQGPRCNRQARKQLGKGLVELVFDAAQGREQRVQLLVEQRQAGEGGHGPSPVA
ncbi:hypothetical protein D3C76_1547430 [compost metagenome]